VKQFHCSFRVRVQHVIRGSFLGLPAAWARRGRPGRRDLAILGTPSFEGQQDRGLHVSPTCPAPGDLWRRLGLGVPGRPRAPSVAGRATPHRSAVLLRREIMLHPLLFPPKLNVGAWEPNQPFKTPDHESGEQIETHGEAANGAASRIRTSFRDQPKRQGLARGDDEKTGHRELGRSRGRRGETPRRRTRRAG